MHVFTEARSSGIGVTDSCESTYRYWASNLGPQQEQQVLSTTDPSLQPLKLRFLKVTHLNQDFAKTSE